MSSVIESQVDTPKKQTLRKIFLDLLIALIGKVMCDITHILITFLKGHSKHSTAEL